MKDEECAFRSALCILLFSAPPRPLRLKNLFACVSVALRPQHAPTGFTTSSRNTSAASSNERNRAP
ncbi:hypothetical protein CfE428DRAFT_1689 [Chthoniobacter flavus Ellin428]|uniref:Uncharacterized protein n=1 Tax=Chthoniobacter flavus Ellin428 TaxID=497964 RepID=B4CYF1_9BACT|nr:hypothetical protein CfE428DRAFT_1689 [Chthoniobacter flavus Ellin428]